MSSISGSSPRRLPRAVRGLIDDAAVFPPGNAPLPEAVTAHRVHRTSWYAPLVGPLLVPASRVGDLAVLGEDLEVGLIGDTGLAGLDHALTASVTIRQVEIPVAKRGEDPLPGLRDLLSWASGQAAVDVYAEIPLTEGYIAALDELAAHTGVAPKFRTGGLAAELFPSPHTLAFAIVACAQRGLRFKLTAGLHRAIRHTDPSTGFDHHGFLNVLVASAAAAEGAEVDDVAALLAQTSRTSVLTRAQRLLHTERPLWIGFGSCSISEPLDDLIDLDLLPEEPDVH